jgi:hypothetical protein
MLCSSAPPLWLTHNDVLAEFVALFLARGLPRQAAVVFVADLQAPPQL